jgi:hypothetical protein
MKEPNDIHGDEHLVPARPEADPDADRDQDWYDQILVNEAIANRNRDAMADIGRALMPENFARIMRNL